MQIKSVYLWLLITLTAYACNNTTSTNNNRATAANLKESENIFKQTDSIELLYYPNPADQRQYKTTMVKKAALLSTLMQNLVHTTVAIPECAHPVKLYLFNNGEVYKTVYVALDDNCYYMAYALNSRPQFVKLQPFSKQLLDSLVVTIQK